MKWQSRVIAYARQSVKKNHDTKNRLFVLCEERIHVYFAEISETAHGQDQDPDENVYPVILSESEVEDGIRKGTIFDAKTLAAWACYKIAK